MKRILSFFIFLCFGLIFLNAQIYIDKSGNVKDNSNSGLLGGNNDIDNNPYKKKGLSAVHNNRFDKSKLVFGGSFGLQFGDYTVINISPQVGYAFSKYFTAGVGIGYTYYKDKYNDGLYNYNEKSSYATFNFYGDFHPIEFIVLSVQPEISRRWLSVDSPIEKYNDSDFVPSFLVGGGLCLGGMTARILYDVVQDDNSPYGNNIFYSVGYSFRF